MPEARSRAGLFAGLRIAALCLLGAGLGGCATTGIMPPTQPRTIAPLKILLTQAPVSIDRRRLQAVFAPEFKPKSQAAADAISEGVKHAREHAAAAMASGLAELPGVVMVEQPERARRSVVEIEGTRYATALSQEQANRIRRSTGADALLRFDITDYGLTPRSWRSGYVTFEVTSTLALAAIIAASGAAAAKAAAGAYLAQEAVEETAEAYAGFWALDVVPCPVGMEAELTRLNPVAEVWRASETAMSGVRLSRLARKVGRRERDLQLDQATDSAVRDIVSALSHALRQMPRATRAAQG